jgi:hypothetical protein
MTLSLDYVSSEYVLQVVCFYEYNTYTHDSLLVSFSLSTLSHLDF